MKVNDDKNQNQNPAAEDPKATVKLTSPDGKKAVMVTPAQAATINAAMNNPELSKSAKIRTLVSCGLTQYKTAQLLGIIPQFVNNVITRDNIKASKPTK